MINQSCSALFRPVTQVAVPGIKRFVAKDHLCRANIICLGPNFKKHFLNLVEKDVRGCVLNIQEIVGDLCNGLILDELKNRAEINLAHFFRLLCRHESQKSCLLFNSAANIGYSRDIIKMLWALHARWDLDDHGWFIEANSVGSRGWIEGDRVISCA